MTSDPVFKVTTFLKSSIGKTARLKDLGKARLVKLGKDKDLDVARRMVGYVTIAQEEKYLTYGMVLCLMTLTDL